MPEWLPQPTVAVRVYEPNPLRDGVRWPDLAIFESARFTRERNSVGNFEIVIPLVAPNRALLDEVRHGWMFEFWSMGAVSKFLFGGYVTQVSWKTTGKIPTVTVRGPSYLGWLNDRRLMGGGFAGDPNAVPPKPPNYIADGTGSQPWSAQAIGLEGPTSGGYRPSINEVMYATMAFNPSSLNPIGGTRELPYIRVPNVYPLSQVTDAWSPNAATPPPSDWSTRGVDGIPRLTKTEITAFMKGMEVMAYLVEKCGDRKNTDPTSPWFGMPRLSFDIIRYDGAPVTDPGPSKGPGWPAPVTYPSNALYFVIKIPGMGTNRSVGNQVNTPVIFDVDGGGVSEAEYLHDSTEVANFMWGLGHGEKAARARYEYTNADSMTLYGRIEDVVDAGQEELGTVIEQKVTEHLNDVSGGKISAKFKIQPTPGQIYGVDFHFDDVITVYWNDIGLVVNEFVTSVTLSIGGSGANSGIQQADITVGSEKLAREGLVLGRYLSGLQAGLSRLLV